MSLTPLGYLLWIVYSRLLRYAQDSQSVSFEGWSEGVLIWALKLTAAIKCAFAIIYT